MRSTFPPAPRRGRRRQASAPLCRSRTPGRRGARTGRPGRRGRRTARWSALPAAQRSSRARSARRAAPRPRGIRPGSPLGARARSEGIPCRARTLRYPRDAAGSPAGAAHRSGCRTEGFPRSAWPSTEYRCCGSPRPPPRSPARAASCPARSDGRGTSAGASGRSCPAPPLILWLHRPGRRRHGAHPNPTAARGFPRCPFHAAVDVSGRAR